MKQWVVAMMGVFCMVALTGCESLNAAAHSKASQGMLLGGLIGAGAGALGGSISDHHRGLGAWVGAGGALGALVGWFVGHQMEEQGKTTSPN